MDEEVEKLYLQNIEEYVFDEDRIVTYKWLSKTLNVHVNTAKQLLYTFTSEIESNRKPELQLTYLIGGLLHDGKGCRFQVVREDDLTKVKNQFKVVTSEHIYSVHKSKPLPDLNILYGIDCIGETEDGGRMQGTILCKKSVRRLEEQLAELRLQSRAASLCGNGKIIPQVTKTNSVKQKPKPEEENQNKEKPSLFTTVSSKSPKEDKDVNSQSPVAMDTTSDAKKSKPPATLLSMFSSQNGKTKKPDSSGQKKSEGAASKAAGKSKPSGSIASMFAHQTSKPKPKADIKPTEERAPDVDRKAAVSNEQPEDQTPVTDQTTAHDQKNDVDKPTTKRKHQTSEKSESKGKNKKPKKSSSKKDSSHPAKKRKRIVVTDISDSSDDDIFGKDEEEEEDNREVEPEPQRQDSEPEDVIPSTPQQEVPKGRKRKRKLVDRTFTDDGYIVTEKEYVFESCSGSEVEEEEEGKENEKIPSETVDAVKSEASTKPAKSAPGKKRTSPKKKPSPPQKAKQMTLTSFFKKN